MRRQGFCHRGFRTETRSYGFSRRRRNPAPPVRQCSGVLRGGDSREPWAARRATVEDFPVAERRRAVGIIVLVLAEKPVAALFVKRDGGAVVVANLERDGLPVVPARECLRRREQRRADPAAAESGIDGERVDPQRATALAQRDQDIAGKRSVDRRGDHRPLGSAQVVGERSPRHPVLRKGVVFERHDGVEIVDGRVANDKAAPSPLIHIDPLTFWLFASLEAPLSTSLGHGIVYEPRRTSLRRRKEGRR